MIDILEISLALIALFMAIVFHEYAHGWVAYRLGDPTAKFMGRLTLNPLAHIDPFGTILMPLVLALLRLPIIGFAKPVPINPHYFRHPYRGMMIVALAGPITNMLLATAGLIIWKTLGFSLATRGILWALSYILAFFIIINVILALFNLIPIPPLDGSRVLAYFLPPKGKEVLGMIERYGLGFILILMLIWLGAFRLIMPLIEWIEVVVLR
jgi:Zn-dependent protease